MANHPSALKRVRQTRVRTLRNRANASRLRTQMKKLRTAIDAKDTAVATELLVPTLAQIDKAIQKGVIHHNAADRYKSHLALAYNTLGTQPASAAKSSKPAKAAKPAAKTSKAKKK